MGGGRVIEPDSAEALAQRLADALNAIEPLYNLKISADESGAWEFTLRVRGRGEGWGVPAAGVADDDDTNTDLRWAVVRYT